MKNNDYKQKALKVKELYDELNKLKGENKWGFMQYAEGMVGDTGDLIKMLMAKANLRGYKGGDLNDDIEHELSDILWSLIIIAEELDIDLLESFGRKMDTLAERVEEKIDKLKSI